MPNKTIRRYGFMVLIGMTLVSLSPMTCGAQAQATRQDAITLVGQAVAELKSAGADATFTDISNPAGRFVKGDLYLVAYDMTGKVLAHGFNHSLIGRDLSKARDPDGKAYVQERIDLAGTQPSFWQSYKYIDPATHSLRMKDSYCVRTGDVIICGGIYH